MEMRQSYGAQYPDLADQLDHMRAGTLPADWDESLPVFPADEKGVATRSSSGKVLNVLAAQVPWLIGGAADLSPSTKRSEEHTSELQSLIRISYAVFGLKKNTNTN